jgi:hypothetical protein
MKLVTYGDVDLQEGWSDGELALAAAWLVLRSQAGLAGERSQCPR